MMRSSILGASTMLNVLIQHLPLQSLSWTKIWKAFRASNPSSCIQELINEFPPIQEKLKILNPVRFILHDIDQKCSCLQNLSPIGEHMSGILLHAINEISSTTLIFKNLSACSLAPHMCANKNQSRKNFIQKRPIESPLKVEFPIPPPEYMLDLLCGSSLYLKIYLDEQDHQNAIQGRDLPYSIPSEKGNSKNRRQVDLQEIEIMNVSIMRKLKFFSRKLFLFLPKNKLNWMILDQLSKIILKSEYHLNYMPDASKWTIITKHFPILYEIHNKPIQLMHLLSILHLILETNRVFVVSSSYFVMTRLLRFTCYVLILYGIKKYERIQCSMMDCKTITITNWVSGFHQFPLIKAQKLCINI